MLGETRWEPRLPNKANIYLGNEIKKKLSEAKLGNRAGWLKTKFVHFHYFTGVYGKILHD